MLNKVRLIGHLGKAPEFKTTNSGQSWASMSVATTKRWKDKAGNKRERTEWHRIVIWPEGLVAVARKLDKGAKVWVEGELASRSWTDDKGIERFVTEILPQWPGDLQGLDRVPGEPEPGERSGQRKVADPEGEDDYGYEREFEDA